MFFLSVPLGFLAAYPIPISAVTCVLVWLWWRKRHPLYPPGPKGIPFIGSLPFLVSSPMRMLKKWSDEKYGPIMSVRFGMREVVILNTYEAIQQTFVKKSTYFSDRPWNTILCANDGQRGIINASYNDTYKMLKKVGLKAMREMCYGEEIIDKESRQLVHFLKSQTGKPCDINYFLRRMNTNLLTGMIFGKRQDYTEEEGEMQKLLDELFNDKNLMLPLMCNWTQYFPPFSGATKRYLKREKALRSTGQFVLIATGDILENKCRDPKLHDVITMHKTMQIDKTDTSKESVRRIVKRHKRNFVKDNVNVLLDAFLQHQADESNDIFSDREIELAFGGMMVAGLSPCRMLSWMVLVLLHHPEYYTALEKEINQVMAKNDRPTAAIRPNMPITNAFIQESCRRFPVAPFGLEHSSTWPAQIGDYYVPGKTPVIANLWGANHDEEFWPQPEKFDPYRHIDAQGQFIPSSRVIAFSLGPRSCIGEGVAKVTLFVWLVDLVRNFKVKPAPHVLPPMDDGDLRIVFTPFPYEVILEEKS